MGERLFIENVRISFPHLFVPRAMDERSEPKFQASFIIPKNHPAVAQIMAARERVIAAEFSGGKQMHRDLPMKDGDNPQVGVPGCYVINASAKTKPHVVDQNVKPIIDPGMIYAGCYVNVSVSIYAYNQKTGNGITFGLDGVQFKSDGERLDGRPSAESMFQPVAGAPAPVAPAPGFASTPAAPVAPFPPAGSGGWTP